MNPNPPPDSGATVAHVPTDPDQTYVSSTQAEDDAPRTVLTAVRITGDRDLVPGYEILGELGRGGMGVVYKARQVALNRQVALKMILAGPHAGDAMLGRFKAEAEAIARLQHPNIVQIYDIGEHNGQPYFSLELIEGGSLEKRVAGQPQNPRAAAHLVEVLARAVQVAHENGIVHRDLKPANILLQPDARSASGGSAANRARLSAATEYGTPKITDFGLAKHTSAGALGRTQSGSILGTPSYMSPEQAQGENKEVGPLTDVYSLGAILYELLVGRPPFRADTPLNTIMEVIRGEPVPPRRIQSKTPRDLETIVLKCLEKPPAKRYPSALYLADDLQRFLDGLPIAARPAGPIERTVKWVRRRPTLAALFATVAVAAAALVAGGVWAYVAVTREAAEARAAHGHAEAALEQARQRQVRLCVANGARQLDGGDLFGSVLWFAEALRLDAGRADREPMHRKRLAAVLGDCPKLLQAWAHDGPVVLAGFSPDGRRAVAAGGDGVVRVWDVATGKPSAPPLEQGGSVAFAEFSADGSKLLTGGSNGNANLWNVADGRRLTTIPVGAALVRGLIHPDGRRVALAVAAGGLQVYGVDGKPLALPLLHGSRVGDVLQDPAGTLFLTAGLDGAAKMWDAATLAPVGQPLKHDAALNDCDFSPDGRFVATGCADGTVRVWRVRTDDQAFAVPVRVRGSVSSVRFNPDGTRLIVASADKSAQVFDATTGRIVTPQLRHASRVATASFSPDGRWVVTGSDDNTARVWDATSGLPLGPVFRHNGTPLAATFAPDGRSVLTGSQDGLARLWGLRLPPAAPPAAPADDAPPSSAASDDGKLVVTFGAEPFARLRRAADREPVGPPLRHDAQVTAAAFRPDGGAVATASADGLVQLWDVADGKAKWEAPPRHASGVEMIAFSADGKRVATAGEDNTALVLDAASGRPLYAPIRHDGSVFHVAFSATGDTLFTASSDGTSRVWDAATGQPLTPPLPPWDRRPWRDTLTPDGRPADDLLALAQAVSGLRVDDQGGLTQLSPAAVRERWARLRGAYPADFSEPAGADRGWHEVQAARAEAARQWFAAAWQLERLAALAPDDAEAPRRLARALGQLGAWERSAAAASRAIDLAPASWDAWQRRGHALGELKRWDDAAADHAQAYALANDPSAAAALVPAVRLAAGDVAGYRKACADLLAKGDAAAARACAFAPDAGDVAAAVRLAESTRPSRPESLRALGAALLRGGQAGPAAERLRESLNLAPHPTTLYLLALAEQRAGRAAAAREAFGRAKAMTPGPQSWLDRQELRWFAAEAEKVIRP